MPSKSYKGIGKGQYKVTRGTRKGKVFRMGKGGTHVYEGKGGKRIVIGKGGSRKVLGPKPPPDPYKKLVDAAANLEFGDAEGQIAKERRISQDQMGKTGDWWNQYKADVAAANARTLQAGVQAQQGVYSQANTARGQDASQAGSMDAYAKEQAAKLGAAPQANPAASAAAARQSLSSSFGGMIGGINAANAAYGNRQYANAGGIRALELGKEAGRGRLIEEEQRKLSAKKGAYRVAKRQELSDADYKKQLEAAAFGVKQQSAASIEADRRADNKRQAAKDRQSKKDQDRRYQETVREHGRVEAERQWKRDHPSSSKGGSKGGGGSFTPTQVRSSRDKYLSIADVARSNKTDRKGTKHSWGWHYKNARAANKGVPPDLVKAALQRGLYGGVEAGLARRIRKMYGLKVKVRKKRREFDRPRAR